jgi:hypothetical protein
MSDTKKLKIKNWANCIQVRKNWKLYVEKAKHSKIGVVAPKEEEENTDHTTNPCYCEHLKSCTKEN